jgi:hypothetical protein
VPALNAPFRDESPNISMLDPPLAVRSARSAMWKFFGAYISGRRYIVAVHGPVVEGRATDHRS